ncbi:hypothetical protein [Vibrio diabolicus]|uniref:hypothetical protein n=1 Tax=Vibrio diabolicus TaxID=50719 RepID=UPI0037529CDD
MEIAKLILEYIKVLIWPCLTIAIIFRFRSEISSRIALIKKIKLPDGTEIDWEETIEEAEEAAQSIKDNPKIGLVEEFNDSEFIEQSKRHSLEISPSDYNFKFYLDIANKNQNLALAGVKIELEMMLRNLAKMFYRNDLDDNTKINSLMRQLWKADVLELDEYLLVESVVKLADAAIEGENIGKNYATRAIESAQEFLKFYKWYIGEGMDRRES